MQSELTVSKTHTSIFCSELNSSCKKDYMDTDTAIPSVKTTDSGNMDPLCKEALKKMRLKFKENLRSSQIIDYLVVHDVLTDADYEEIKEDKENNKITYILDILPKRGQRAYEIFLKALRYQKAYTWLAEELENQLQKLQNRLSADTLQIWQNNLVKGGVPDKIMHYVERTTIVQAIRTKLETLSKERGWLMLHGMAGSGKSVLAAESIRGHHLLSYFPGGVFWVAVGQVDDGTLLIKMQALCERLDKDCRNHAATSIEQASHRLRDSFAQDEYSGALLVLDDVWTQTVVKAFDIGIPVLVTTRDSTIDDAMARHIPVPVVPDLSVDESKLLLAKHLGTEVDKLPEQADVIHEIYKGFPMAIAMVGARISNHHEDKSLWQHCVNEAVGRRRHSSAGKLASEERMSQAIRSNVGCLGEKDKLYYEDFAMFIDDVLIPREVFVTLWDVDKFAVDEIMLQFQKKSLVTCEWNVKKETYYYGIHDLLQNFLREEQHNQLQYLHKKLIVKYEELCNGMWENLPQDGYIQFYLGHHLWKAGMEDLMSDIYLDLKFVIAKLNVAGPGDLLYDYRYYGSIIQKKNPFAKKDFESFIRVNSHLVGDGALDILQLALSQPQTSAVYTQAKQLVLKSDSSNVYLEWHTRDGIKTACKGSVKLHTEPVLSALFTPSGKEIISCGFDNMIRVYNYEMGKERLQFRGHDGKIICCSLSENGERLVTCSSDGTIKVWLTSGLENGHSNAELSPVVAMCDDKDEYKPGQKPAVDKIITFSVKEKLACCAISPDGAEVLSGGEGGAAKVWAVPANIEKGVTCEKETCFLEGHLGEKVTACRYAINGSVMATASECGTIMIWNRKTKKLLNKVVGEIKAICSCCFYPDASQIATASNHSVVVWDITTGAKVLKLEDPYRSCVTSVSVSRDGTLLAAGTAGPTIIVWDLKKNKIIASHKGHKQWIHCVSFSRDGKQLLSTSEDKTVMLWDATVASDTQNYRLAFCSAIDNGNVTVAAPDLNRRIQILRGTNDMVMLELDSSSVVQCSTMTLKTDKLALGFEDGSVQVYYIDDNPPKSLHILNEHSKSVGCCMFASDSRALVTGSEDATVRIWTFANANASCTSVLCEGHRETVLDVRFYSKDSKVLSCSMDGTLIAWDRTTGSLLFTCCGQEESFLACDICPNEEYFLSASSDKRAMLWRAVDGALENTVHHDSCVRSCRFFPDGKRFVTGDDNGFFKVWTMDSTGKDPDLEIKAHDNWIHDLAVSKTSQMLVTVSNTLKWWDLNTSKCLQTFQLQGSVAKRICVSNDFKTFVTIDDAGVLYVLKVIDRLQTP